MTNPSKIPNPKSSMLTDDQWSHLQPLLPPPSKYLRGRPPLDDRLILEAILYKICHAIPWYDLPGDFPSHQTVYRRYRQWRRLGLWKRLLQELAADLNGRGGFSIFQAFDDHIYREKFSQTHWTVTLDPAVPLTWQVLTGWVFANLFARLADLYSRDRQRASHTSLYDLPV
jgi:transposase